MRSKPPTRAARADPERRSAALPRKQRGVSPALSTRGRTTTIWPSRRSPPGMPRVAPFRCAREAPQPLDGWRNRGRARPRGLRDPARPPRPRRRGDAGAHHDGARGVRALRRRRGQAAVLGRERRSSGHPRRPPPRRRPAAECGNVARAVDRRGLDQKPLTTRLSASWIELIDSGGGTAATKRPAVGRQRPDLDLDRGAGAVRDAQQAGLAGAGLGERIEPIGPPPSRRLSRGRAPSARSSPLSGMPERCAPTTASAISSLADAGRGASAGCGICKAPSGQRGRGMEGATDRGEQRVSAAGRQQRDAERLRAAMQRGRHRQTAHVEQVDEIGVGAEPAVELNRIGQHVGETSETVGAVGSASRSTRWNACSAARRSSSSR